MNKDMTEDLGYRYSGTETVQI